MAPARQVLSMSAGAASAVQGANLPMAHVPMLVLVAAGLLVRVLISFAGYSGVFADALRAVFQRCFAFQGSHA